MWDDKLVQGCIEGYKCDGKVESVLDETGVCKLALRRYKVILVSYSLVQWWSKFSE